MAVTDGLLPPWVKRDTRAYDNPGEFEIDWDAWASWTAGALGRIADAGERIADALEKQTAAASFLDDALQPPNGDAELTLENLDFYRTPDGRFVVRAPEGDRLPTPAEADMLNGTIARRARGR